MLRFPVILAGILVLSGVDLDAARADKATGAADLAVDQVSLKGGPRLLGEILGREADGTLAFAVGRAWLKKTHTRYFEQALKDETAETRAALTELSDRVARWRKARSADKELEFFLDKEAERVEKELKALEAGTREEDAAFLVLDLPPAKIERVVSQPPQRRRIALAAWREGLADIETRSAASLAQELKQKKVEPADDPDALLDLLPARRQNDAAWAARQAIVEYRFRKPLDFQGAGDAIFKTGEAVKADDLAPLLGELLKSMLGGDLLSDLIGQPQTGGTDKATGKSGPGETWLASAAKIAESEDLAGFHVTRVEQDLAAKRAAVETRFVARLPDGSWKTIWQQTVQADASKPRPDAERQIENDPRVRAALQLFKSLGAQGDEQIKQAVRFGAATQEAQKESDSRFFEFRDRHLKQLDGPVLRIPPAAPPAPVKPARK
jgi:hypothetical protein